MGSLAKKSDKKTSIQAQIGVLEGVGLRFGALVVLEV